MTADDYEQLLEKYEEIEDLTCTICLEKMKLDEVIVRTLCSSSFKSRELKKVTQYFKDNQEPTSSKKVNDKDSLYVCDPLSGHKFHKSCFQQFMNAQRERLKDTNEIFHRCPVCREDVLIKQNPSSAYMQSTVLGSKLMLSSLKNKVLSNSII